MGDNHSDIELERKMIYFVTGNGNEMKEHLFFRTRKHDGSWTYNSCSFKFGSIYCAFIDRLTTFANEVRSCPVLSSSEVSNKKRTTLQSNDVQEEILACNALIWKYLNIPSRVVLSPKQKGSCSQYYNEIVLGRILIQPRAGDKTVPLLSRVFSSRKGIELRNLFDFFLNDAPYSLYRNMDDPEMYCMDMYKTASFEIKDLLHESELYDLFKDDKRNAFYNRVLLKVSIIMHCKDNIRNLDNSAKEWIWHFVGLNQSKQLVCSRIEDFLYECERNDSACRCIEEALNKEMYEIRWDLLRSVNRRGEYTGNIAFDSFDDQHLFIFSNLTELYMISTYAYHRYKNTNDTIKKCKNCNTYFPSVKGKEFLCPSCKPTVKYAQQQIQDRITNNRRKFIRLIEQERLIPTSSTEKNRERKNYYDAQSRSGGTFDLKNYEKCGNSLFVYMAKILAICMLDYQYHEYNSFETNKNLRKLTPEQNKRVVKIMDNCNLSIASYKSRKLTGEAYVCLPSITIPNEDFTDSETRCCTVLNLFGIESCQTSLTITDPERLNKDFVYRFCKELIKLKAKIDYPQKGSYSSGTKSDIDEVGYSEFISRKCDENTVFEYYKELMSEHGILAVKQNITNAQSKPLIDHILRNFQENLKQRVVHSPTNHKTMAYQQAEFDR